MPLSDLRTLHTLSLEQIRARDPGLADEVERLAGPRTPPGSRVKRPGLRPGMPVSSHPAIARTVAEARLSAVAGRAGLAGGAAAGVVAAGLADGIEDASLARLIAAGTLGEEQARAVGLLTSMTALADGDEDLAVTLRDAAARRLGRTPALRDLAALTADDWRAALDGAALPAGATADRMAGALAGRLAAAFPGVALASRLPRPQPGDAGQELAIRALEALDTASLLEVDLSPDSADRAQLGLDRAEPSAAAAALATLRSYQRAMAVGKSVDDTVALVSAGYGSAFAVANETFARFAERSGLPVARARQAHDSARSILAGASLGAAAALDGTHGLFDLIQVGNFRPSLANQLKALPGYEALFGSLSLCDCEECNSILGAAAYFVDLMKFIDEHIRSQLAGHADHPLDLRTRRPDLWHLPLTCDNTNQRIPTLEIANEILENHIARDAGFAGPLADRTAVRAAVYPALATTVDSFRQPFDLPLARITAYLPALGGDLQRSAAAAGAPAARLARAILGLGAAEWQLVVTPAADLGQLAGFYGLTFSGTPDQVARFDATPFLAATGLERPALGEAIATAFVRTGGANARITAGKRSAESVQNDVEWVDGLTADVLDRLHRMTRLQRRGRWSFAELDRVLSAVGDPSLGESGLTSVARLRAIEARLGLQVDELCGLVAPLPLAPAGESLFDRRFNPPTLVAADGAWPAPARRFVDPALRATTAAPADPALARLTAGLGIDLARLSALVRHLAPRLTREGAAPFDPAAANEDDRYFVLSIENLTLLHRHALAARKLRVSIDDLFQLLGFLDRDHLGGLDDLEALLDLHGWWRTSRARLDHIALALGRAPRDAALDQLPAHHAADLVAGAGEALEFHDTVFAVSPGVAEGASRELLLANPGLVEVIEGSDPPRWRVRPEVELDAAPVAVPASAQVRDAGLPGGFRPATEAEIRAALRPYTPAEVVLRGVAARLGLELGKAAALIALAGQSAGSAAVAGALRGGPVDPLVELLRATWTLALALPGAAWDPAAVGMVAGAPQLFGAGPLPSLAATPDHPRAPFVTLDQLRALSIYDRLARRTGFVDGIPVAADPAGLRAALAAFDPASGFPPSVEPDLARGLGLPLGLVVGLRGRLPLGPLAAGALDRLDGAAQIAASLGIDGEAFSGLVSDDFAAVDRAADALGAALRARNPDEEIRARVIDETERPVRERRRDALCDFMLRSVTPRPWKTVEDLYRTFLIDVEAGGCSTTSRVVAAISSAQLYVHRVRMNLEQDTRPEGHAEHVELELGEEAAAEWTWRQNYRVWQANRKVYLWPENYLVPFVRDDKTPQFEELESELLQQDVDDQHVLDAYSKYVAGFEEVASLLIAGAYHDRFADGDVLHLIGVAPSDPPIYYHRSCQDLIAGDGDPARAPVWSPWRKISVQITARRVAPVVHNGRLHLFWSAVKTRPLNSLVDGKSVFGGYSHRYSMYVTTLRADGSWTAPQSVELPADYWLGPSRGEVQDLLVDQIPELDPQRRIHVEAIDDYSLAGVNWDGIWPTSQDGHLYLRFRDFLEACRIDLFARTASSGSASAPHPQPTVLCARAGSPRPLYYGRPALPWWEAAAIGNVAIEQERLDRLDLDLPGLKEFLLPGLYKEQIASVPDTAGLLAIVGSVEDAVIQAGHDVLLVQGSTRSDDHYLLRRIGTTLARTIARTLFEDGVDTLLDTETQLALAEHGLPIELVGSRIEDASNSGALDFTGPYGVYYRELFFHIPYLIGNALNAQARYASAQAWFHRVFDPTSTEKITVPPGTPPAERARRKLDRVWRYREFRGLDVTTLRDILSDKDAIELYKRDPFNPFAIARTRLSAFQKAVVMKYLDNLLDWADDLFTRFTMESVNEALMLYVTALDILGPRPALLGDCGEGGPGQRTYAQIAPLIDESSEMLIEFENLLGRRPGRGVGAARPTRPTYTIHPSALGRAVASHPLAALGASAAAAPMTDKVRTTTTRARAISPAPARATGAALAAPSGGMSRMVDAQATFTPSKIGRFGWSILRQVRPVFCVPPNPDLLAYWDRVEDRLYKIRNCMDITGQLRELALFAPPIDPMMLVAARAAGLSLEDVLAAGRGSVPAYRFAFLIERAKAMAVSLSAFGSALLAALEKKDGEEMNRLRLVQQKNIAAMNRQLRQLDIDAASEALESSRRQLEAAEYRLGYYDELISAGRNEWEIAQSVGQHTASGVYGMAGITNMVAAALRLVPNSGSPFAMTYGGEEMGESAKAFALASGAAAMAGEALARSAGLEAGFVRRDEGWDHQREVARWDIQVLKRQIRAGEIRLDQANRALTLHEKGQEHIDEQLELLDGKFTSLGLYAWLARRLQGLYRAAYQNASGVARLAEQAFRFERGDTSVGLEPSYWDGEKGGLLAGEALLAGLQTLERRYLESNVRPLEVDQAFSTAQIDPAALIMLRESGQCTIAIPEVFFDLFYPGQYRRRIKAVRLTIPCITGPYVNVGATLALTRSWLRESAAPEAELVELPPSRSVSIATSAGQADAGVFELTFRDERYMPFEGLGAVSEWQLTLPRAFRQFDYQTITDVILTISYTAEHSGALRDRVESQNASLLGGILQHFTDNPSQRLFSFRQDFSGLFTRLLRSPVGTPIAFEIGDRNLPLLFKGRDLEITQATLLVRTAAGAPPTGLELMVDGTGIAAFAPSPAFGGLFAAPLPPGFGSNLRGTHTVALAAAGELASPEAPGDPSVLDPDRLLDLLVHLQMRLA